MTNEAERIKLAEAMGLKDSFGLPVDRNYPFDPFHDANDDYAVLEWAIKNLDPDAYFIALTEVVGSYAYLTEYRIGYWATAALRALEQANE